MSEWSSVITFLCLLLILLSLISLLRTLRSLKALKNLFYYKSFTLNLNEVVQSVNKVTVFSACKRIIHEIGFFTYSDLQFDLPPALHTLLFLCFLSLLMMVAWVGEITSDSEATFHGDAAVGVSLVGTGIGLALALGTEALFVRGLNARNRGRTSKEYNINQESHSVSALPVDSEVPIALNRTLEDETEGRSADVEVRQELTFRNVGEERRQKDEKQVEGNVGVEVVLMVVGMATTGAALWGIYMTTEVTFPACFLYWIFAAVVDIPLRLAFCCFLTLVRWFPNPRRHFKRLDYSLSPKDLSRFLSAPNPDQPTVTDPMLCGPGEVFLEEQGRVHTTLSDDTMRQHWSTLRRNQNTVNEGEIVLEEPPQRESSRKKETENSQLSGCDGSDRDIDGQLQSPASLETPRLMPAIFNVTRSAQSSSPATDRDPTFPPLIHIQRISALIDAMPMEAVFPGSSPRPQASHDEFPIPPLVDRFSDIEGSPRESEEGISSIPITKTVSLSPKRKKVSEAADVQKRTSPQRPPLRTSSPMSDALFGQRLFGKGKPLKSVRSSRSLRPEKHHGGRSLRPQLEAIVSENEEDFDWNVPQDINRSQSLAVLRSNRCASPEAAESTRYQTPNSPVIVLHLEEFRQYAEPKREDEQKFEANQPLPPVSIESDVFFRPSSPTVAEDARVSFITSETASSRAATLRHTVHPSQRTGDDSSSDRRVILASIVRDGVLGRRQRLGDERQDERRRPRRDRSDFESPYEEILWRRLPDDESSGLPRVARTPPHGPQRGSKLQTLYDSYKEGSSRPMSNLIRHRSLAPLSRGGDGHLHGFRTVSRASLLDHIPKE